MRKRKLKPGDKVLIFSAHDSTYTVISQKGMEGVRGIVSSIDFEPKTRPRYIKSRKKVRGSHHVINVALSELFEGKIMGVYTESNAVYWRFVFCGEASVEELVTHIDSDIRELGRRKISKEKR